VEHLARISQKKVPTTALSSATHAEMGLYKFKCPKNKSTKRATGKQLERETDTVLMMVEGGIKPCNNIWIANSAPSMHITNSKVGLYNIKDICKPVKIVDGKLVYTMKVGLAQGYLHKPRKGEQRIHVRKCSVHPWFLD